MKEQPMTVHVVAPTEGEVIQVGPITLRIIEDGSHTDHRVALVEGTLPPGSVGPPQHVHRRHDETFHVVSGTVRFTCGGEHVDAGPGTTVTAPIGVPHTFANPGDVPAVFVGTLTPDLYVGRLLPGAEVDPVGGRRPRRRRARRADGAVRDRDRPARGRVVTPRRLSV
jgi:mannose-6-phosphate isomerase-like protein (cupin superfamily)